MSPIFKFLKHSCRSTISSN